jgi:hypothetical protein
MCLAKCHRQGMVSEVTEREEKQGGYDNVSVLHADTLVVLVKSFGQLTQLEKLHFSLVKTEVPFEDGSEELTDVMIENLGKMICLRCLFLGHIPWVTAEEVSRIIRYDFLPFFRIRNWIYCAAMLSCALFLPAS